VLLNVVMAVLLGAFAEASAGEAMNDEAARKQLVCLVFV
jgi:hypothetical protein